MDQSYRPLNAYEGEGWRLQSYGYCALTKLVTFLSSSSPPRCCTWLRSTRHPLPWYYTHLTSGPHQEPLSDLHADPHSLLLTTRTRPAHISCAQQWRSPGQLARQRRLWMVAVLTLPAAPASRLSFAWVTTHAKAQSN